MDWLNFHTSLYCGFLIFNFTKNTLFFFKVSPQIVPFTFGDGPANSGESMSTICTISRGDYPLEFLWYLDGEKILTKDREDISISNTKRRSVLEIESVSAHHAGEYTCAVSNAAGATSHSSILIVNGNLTYIQANEILNSQLM